MSGVATFTPEEASVLLKLDRRGRPMASDLRFLARVVSELQQTRDERAHAFLVDRFFGDAQARYDEYVAPLMVQVGPARFAMGTKPEAAFHFCGETPEHTVALSSFQLSRVLVTNELFGLFDARRLDVSRRARKHPVTDITWYEAATFAAWIGCRLPTEAEWEYACGGGARSDWCCGRESELSQFAWYSENASGIMHPVATRAPNRLGLFDLHGLAWEWCEDVYDGAYYAHSCSRDPVNQAPTPTPPPTRDDGVHRVCRGGSIHALAEMCRTRYRMHEPSGFWAADLGFRLAARDSR